jgi:bifunctional non-homologous end joining protein LigD
MSKKQLVEIDGREITLSNAKKVYYPGSGFTKGEVVEYYDAMAPVILPHLEDRPLTLKRYPDGVTGAHFYEKNAPSHTPAWVKRIAVPRSEGGGDIHYILCNNRATLLWATNLGDIEKHVLLAKAPYLNRPTSIVFDLDPGEPASILDCGEVALELRSLLAGFDLECFVKVSGSKGLHLAVPLNTDVAYELTQPFAKTVAELMVDRMAGRVVSEMSKRLRRGKVLIDWSQNSDFKTTVCVYAMRAKHSEPFISMPVTWAELARAVKRKNKEALFFTPKEAIKRIKRLGDLYEPVLKLRQKLPAAFIKAIASGPPPKLSSWPKDRGKTRDKSLREYTAKRDPTRTPEPAAAVRGSETKSRLRFVVQKHAASHLHYDWRLEMQGVLRSWAVPKGPPKQPRETRLAMHVEDHPMDYADFEGTIPPGNYGAGTVMVWDQGEYDDISGNAAAAFHQGKMHIVMRGKKLKGEWILVKDRRDDEGNRWLLIKAGEPIVITAKADDTSAISGRSMAAIAKANDKQWQSNRPAAKAKGTRRGKRSVPTFVHPMQCKPVTALPDKDEWIFEIKFDGYRAIAVKNDGAVTLYSRNHKKLNDRFPEIVHALEAIPGDFSIDGEIVALDAKDRPSFQILQNSSSNNVRAYFYAFDLLHRGDRDLRAQVIETRRAELEDLLTPADPLRLSPVLKGTPEQIVEAVIKLGLEGIIGKQAGSTYEPGECSGSWIKFRLNRGQEFVIGGYVPGAHGFDALLVGVHAKRQLQYVAKVRNGFVARVKKEIFPSLKERRVDQCPFPNLPETKSSRWGEPLTAKKMKDCVWVKPQLVCQVDFVEWTESGKLRHCSFVAMRDDKPASKVVREM